MAEKNEKKERLNEVTTGFTVGNFPLSLAREWFKDCYTNYNNCYWMKIWSDHMKSKERDYMLKGIVTEVQEQPEEEKEKEASVGTIGGNEIKECE